MASGTKSGSKDSGSVAPLKGSSKVDRHEKVTNTEFAKGGDTAMFGEQAAGEQTPAHTGKAPTSAPGAEFAKGGSGKMFGFAASQPATAGQTSAR